MRKQFFSHVASPFTLIALAFFCLAGNGFSQQYIKCGTVAPDYDHQLQIRDRTQDWLSNRGGRSLDAAGDPIEIPVVFHVVRYNNGSADVPDAQIHEQLDSLNRGFSTTNFSFTLDHINRVNNTAWTTHTGSSDPNGLAMKQALADDPAHKLNIYLCDLGGGLLGYATFPWYYPENDYRHGVVVLYTSLPGGSAVPYDEGDTATHEVGHYVGLYHTFQNGCTAPGDEVDDTPYEASPNYGCSGNPDTCPAPGLDPITNFMDYSDDACLVEFTSDQSGRMDTYVAQYKPSLGEPGGGGENTPPVVTISSPVNGQGFPSGATVSFSASASDAEDGNLTASTAVWSISGPGVPPGYVFATNTFSPSGIPPQNGDYTATLEVSDSEGLPGSASVTFTIGVTPNQSPTAVAEANVTSGNAPLTVNFTGDNSSDSDGNITDYAWDFDDGSPGASQANPTHEFTSAGTFNVELTVTDDDGATDTDQITITVTDPQQNQPPTAVAEANVTSGNAPLTVNFTGDNSSDSDGNITDYAWDFDDGSPGASQANPTHEFTSAGTFIVELTVTDDDGATDTDQITITVTEPQQNQPPVATITSPANGQNYSTGSTISYAGTGTDPEDGTLGASAFTWLYTRNGGPETVFATNVTSGSIVGSYPGNYAVILEVEDSEGATDRDQINITIGGGRIAKGASEEKGLVSLEEYAAMEVPDGYSLSAAYPNPFRSGATSRGSGNPETRFEFSLPNQEVVTLKIYNSLGQQVKSLLNEQQTAAGSHHMTWNATNNHGQRVPSGTYYLTIEAGEFRSIQKLSLLK